MHVIILVQENLNLVKKKCIFSFACFHILTNKKVPNVMLENQIFDDLL